MSHWGAVVSHIKSLVKPFAVFHCGNGHYIMTFNLIVRSYSWNVDSRAYTLGRACGFSFIHISRVNGHTVSHSVWRCRRHHKNFKWKNLSYRTFCAFPLYFLSKQLFLFALEMIPIKLNDSIMSYWMSRLSTTRGKLCFSISVLSVNLPNEFPAFNWNDNAIFSDLPRFHFHMAPFHCATAVLHWSLSPRQFINETTKTLHESIQNFRMNTEWNRKITTTTKWNRKLKDCLRCDALHKPSTKQRIEQNSFMLSFYRCSTVWNGF